MKGFPNQIADLQKLAKGLRIIEQLLEAGTNPKDDGVFGRALVEAGLLGTGHTPIPVAQYLKQQDDKNPNRQGFRTSARGLRELFRLLKLIDDGGEELVATANGRIAATYANAGFGEEQIAFWRRVISGLYHLGGDSTGSHPYQVMLRLVARNPGITRAYCALALEARDDSAEELDRIVALSELDEQEIRDRIGVTKSNWDNAKKVIPKFAEQLGDVIKTGDSYQIADAPGSRTTGATARPAIAAAAPRQPRGSREVTPTTIGMAGLADSETEEFPLPPANLDPETRRRANELRLNRLRRHNLIVREVAARFVRAGMRIFESPYDVLAVSDTAGILTEVKTLDGSPEDERDRVREAYAQLPYYEAFVTPPGGGTYTRRLACFESEITEGHQRWLNQAEIATIWTGSNGLFDGDALAHRLFRDIFKEFR